MPEVVLLVIGVLAFVLINIGMVLLVIDSLSRRK